ncbi:unnamed protein product [Lepeophtheirus salmonis]|uniref:(salmon louse) hypothetical protein n=1 Tax=Lepeophtheirus salmonis TaxID=72036 RepID=A0A7R8D8B6_LEPSM|nr:unnamed protein product [Lepeophtheirus salmonis]CAF3034043.1 unnamed protein product [Lepeophtheirus salmonis]
MARVMKENPLAHYVITPFIIRRSADQPLLLKLRIQPVSLRYFFLEDGRDTLLILLENDYYMETKPLWMLRGEAREKYGIEGSTGEDAMTAFCCGPCVQCQTGTEIKERGDSN